MCMKLKQSLFMLHMLLLFRKIDMSVHTIKVQKYKNEFKRRIGWKDGTSWSGLIGLNVYFNRIELCHRLNWFLDLIGFMCRLHFVSRRSGKNKSSIYSKCRRKASCPVIRVQDRHGQCGERHLKSQPLGGNGRESKACLSQEHRRKIREEMLANVAM